MSALPDEGGDFRSAIKAVWHRCRDWIAGYPASDLPCCGEAEIERIAHDIQMSPAELHALIRGGPGAADLLLERMAALDLDPKEVSQVEPQTFRDLQRSCALCESKRQCDRDLTGKAASPEWKDYCPNAAALLALDAMPWKSRKEW
jgi:hypothetical protein